MNLLPLPWLLPLALLAGAATPKSTDTVTVYRCVDGKGHVTLQDDPCPAGARSTSRQMQRPKDAPPRPIAPRQPEPAPVPPPRPAPPLIPPPPMYHCTSYDGIERFSEQYDPNPRCEPLGLYYSPNQLSPELRQTCRWVEDSCVRLSDESACAVWRKRYPEAKSAALHAFSNTAAYRKSEVERIGRILRESCGG